MKVFSIFLLYIGLIRYLRTKENDYVSEFVYSKIENKLIVVG